MTKVIQTYVHHGKDFNIVNRAEGEEKTKLPVGVYRLNFHQLRGWWFSELQAFEMPAKLYGNTTERAKRILISYRERLKLGKPTGVLLDGEKGAGKTLLAKKTAIDSNLPVIIISQKHESDDFKEIIANVGECVVIFDEFEKVFNTPELQNSVLTLLDGAFASKALTFVITNEADRLVGPLKNRPGRLHYFFEYGSLDEKFIKEYCADNITYSDSTDYEVKVAGIISVATMMKAFTFDQLQAIVEEMNRFNESAESVIEYLNVKIPKPGMFESYSVRIWKDGVEITDIQDSAFKVQHRMPINESMYIYYRTTEVSGNSVIPNEECEEDDSKKYVYFSAKNLIGTDVKNLTYMFANENKSIKISFTKIASAVNFNAF